MTGNANTIRYIYKVERTKKQYTNYQLESVSLKTNSDFQDYTGIRLLTDLVRIEKDRKYHKANGFKNWFRMKTGTNWSKCKITTGLFFTDVQGVFYGDHFDKGKRNLLIFQFSSDLSTLTIDYYSNYCPYNRPTKKTPELNTLLLKYSNTH